jgi:acyl carrier protein
MAPADELFARLRTHLSVMFEIPEEKIVPEARLYEDLDLDSIDAVDLMVKLQEITQRKLKPEEFKTVRTVQDVLDRINAILAE